MTGTLFVVATPIGNLEDITLRALRTLREVSVIAAEDTRRTRHLLSRYDIKTPLLSLHEHNERRRIAGVLDRLRRGESVALVSDAGTPGISDPGALLVRAAREADVRVDAIPGPSAVTAALSASGLSFERFVFAGFPPIRSKDRDTWLRWVDSLADIPVVCFEAPHRIQRTLKDLRGLSVNRPITVAREITKLHEEWLFLANNQIEPDETEIPLSVPKGEFVIILAPGTDTEADTPSDEQVASVFGLMTDSGRFEGRKEAIRAVARQLHISSKAVFDALERVKNASRT
jgi:16S rRNA (cytidine1402-2'-O)-methyltransferase